MRNRKFWNGTVYQGLLCCDWRWMKMGVYSTHNSKTNSTVSIVRLLEVGIERLI